MKNAFHILFCVIFSVIVLNCKKDIPPYEESSVPEISNLSRNISLPAPGISVVVSATIITPESAPIYTVILKWTVNDANSLSVSMRREGNGNVYSATIPGQSATGTIVKYTVSAHNKNGTSEESASYVVSEAPVEYFQLALNEINGNGEDQDKYIELYNNSLWAVPLHGVTIYYNNFDSEAELTWTGTDQVIKSKSFLLLKGAHGTGDLRRGLSATKGIVVEMKDPDENTIDIFSIGEDDYRLNSCSRLPDGTGKWHLTFWSGTPGVTNGPNYGSQIIPSRPIIINFTRNISTPTETDEVKVFSTVKAFSGTTLSSVVFKWTLGGISQSEITMTNEGDVFSATIPALATGSVIAYTVTATNNESEKVEVSSSYIVKKDGIIDYSKLKLNEVSGVGNDDVKFYELINTGTEDILLADCKIYYNANGSVGESFPPTDNRLSWTGNAMQVLKGGELFCLIGRNAPGSFTTGLTPERILIITLTDPAGNVLDQCIRSQDTGEFAGKDKSFSRIPDGTGPFYFTTPTPNKMNGTSPAGLLLVPQGVDFPHNVDYTKLKLNEVSGVGNNDEKFYELINTGADDISLYGCKIYYNANSSTGGALPSGKGNLTWTGLSTQKIEAGKLFSLIGRNNPAGASPGSFTTGLTAQRILIITLEDPFGKIIDQCIRALDTGDYAFTDKSFSRIPDGTGTFYFTTPTPDKLNGTSTEGLVLVPVTQ